MALFLTQNLFVASGIDYLIYLTRPSRSGCNPRVSWAGSLSLGRQLPLHIATGLVNMPQLANSP